MNPTILELLTKKLLLLTALLSFYQTHPNLIPKEPPKFGAILPMTDYKFWYVMRDDNGFITEAGVRFFEGAVTTQNELVYPSATSSTQVLAPVTRYRRTKRLGQLDLPSIKAFGTDTVGNPAVIYKQKDFGQIKTDDELRVFLNKELAKDTTRIPVPEETNK